ncbi:hypothetical protein KC660_04235, partial [Candidatus Dojkabacteria bacterium]|nr:hypothetical protein [Candidatus Dojkabacteria bacterium]
TQRRNEIDTPVDSNSNSEADTNTNEPTILPDPTRSSDTCTVVSQNTLPTNWPNDFMLYPGATVTSVKCAPTSADLYEVRTIAKADFDSVVSYFEAQVVNAGWTITDNADNDLYDTYSAYKLLNAEKKHTNSTRQMILDIRERLDGSDGGVEVIYREREW